jgi:hypothetical protein
MELRDIAELKFRSDDLNETLTIREYLQRLLTTLWYEEEGFSGKRPFGNSSWQYEVFDPLVRYGVVPGDIEKCPDGRAWPHDNKAAHKIIADLIHYIFQGD